METEFQSGIRKLLLTSIHFVNPQARTALLTQCVKFLFDAKQHIKTKEELKALFYPVRNKVVSEEMPAMYSPEKAEQEEQHFDFICDVEEIVIQWNPPPHLYSSTYEEFITAHKYWL